MTFSLYEWAAQGAGLKAQGLKNLDRRNKTKRLVFIHYYSSFDVGCWTLNVHIYFPCALCLVP